MTAPQHTTCRGRTPHRRLRAADDARPAPRRRRPRRLLSATVLLALAVAGTGCSAFSNEPERYTRTCGVVLDGSGSAAPGDKGFDSEAKTKANLTAFLADRECSTVYFAPITKVSRSSPCRVSRVGLDPDLPDEADRDSVRTTMRGIALKSALELLHCAQRRAPGSDVIGGLYLIAQKKPSGGEPFDVLVVSDFDQGDSDFRLGDQDLTSRAKRATVIDHLLSGNGKPQLAGADLYPAGWGMAHEKATRVPQFDAFWTELLEGRVKAHVHTDYQ
jgi:hypothetical protein